MARCLYLLIVISISYILSGCNSTKNVQSESIYIDYDKFRKEQVIEFFKNIERKGEYAIVNNYRQYILDNVNPADFVSDTIIFYEDISTNEMAIGQIYYSGSIYTSYSKLISSYRNNKLSDLPLESVVEKEKLSISFRIKYLDEVGPDYYFKNLITFINQGRLEQLLKNKKRERNTIPASYSQNMLIVAIKRGQLYQIESYKNISLTFSPETYFEIGSLEHEEIDSSYER